MWTIDKKERVCGNCKHWDIDHESLVTTKGGFWGTTQHRLCPCLADAIEPDAGEGALLLLGPASHCHMHADTWEPSKEYLEELSYTKDARQAGERPWHGDLAGGWA